MLFIITFGMLLSLMGIMSIGVVLGGKRLQGSCGGVGSSCACDAAGRPRACEGPNDGGGQLSAVDQEVLATLPGPGEYGRSRPSST